MKRVVTIVLASWSVAISGCTTGMGDIPAGVGALPANVDRAEFRPPLAVYHLGLLDEVSVNVFDEPDLSAGRVVVDLAGKITLPLLGQIDAAGRTTDEVGAEISQRLNTRYLRDAKVAVALTKATSYAFTVEGEVNKPGSYPIPGTVSLLQAVAIGEGVTDTADLSQVVIFRNAGGKRYAARFSLSDIRAAKTDDPMLQSGDVVVVGYSAAQQIYRDVLSILPGVAGVFVAISQNN